MTNTRSSAGLGGNSSAQLKAFIERIERLEEEKKALSDDIRSIYAEAKEAEFDTKALRAIIKRRKADPDKLKAHEETVEAYMHALGMLADTPLGRAAIERRTTV